MSVVNKAQRDDGDQTKTCITEVRRGRISVILKRVEMAGIWQPLGCGNVQLERELRVI